jgi:hypothetical protein
LIPRRLAASAALIHSYSAICRLPLPLPSPGRPGVLARAGPADEP